MSSAGHGGLPPRALSGTHTAYPFSRNGAKTFKSLWIHFPLLLLLVERFVFVFGIYHEKLRKFYLVSLVAWLKLFSRLCYEGKPISLAGLAH